VKKLQQYSEQTFEGIKHYTDWLLKRQKLLVQKANMISCKLRKFII